MNNENDDDSVYYIRDCIFNLFERMGEPSVHITILPETREIIGLEDDNQTRWTIVNCGWEL